MNDVGLVLIVTPSPGAVVVSTIIAKNLTTVGSDPSADLRIPALPARWAVVQKLAGAIELRILGRGGPQRLGPDDEILVDGVRVGVRRRADEQASLPVAEITDALVGVESASEALRRTLRAVVQATHADVGAIVVNESGQYRVAAAELRGATDFDGSADLLSDTILRDVLGGDRSVCLDDASADERYANVLSVTTLRLRSVACVPMTLGGRVLGAIFLGRHEVVRAFGPRQLADLIVIAQMAVPLIVQLRRLEMGLGVGHDLLVGESPSIHRARRFIERVGPVDANVLVLGETGTGKEVAARAIHAASSRAGRALVAINCSAVPESLLGAELFGSKRGAYTGAISDRKGSIEQADGSTLFLDEIGDMPAVMQAALLRVIEQREVIRVGETQPRPVDFRLVAATHRDLDAEVAAGRFRADLLYRLREVTLTLPPLADRREDILLLAQLFLRQAEAQFSLQLHRLGRDARDALEAYRWPGNVRELRSTMRRAVLLCDGGDIAVEHLQLPPAIADRGPSGEATVAIQLPAGPCTLASARERFEAQFIASVLAQHGGNRARAADSLGISVRSLYRALEKD